MKRICLLALTIVAASTVVVSTTLAQGRGRNDRGNNPRDRDRQVVVLDRDGIVIRPEILDRRTRDRGLRNHRFGKAKGPKFCRSGAGHPVHGRAWCLRKGFGLGDRRFPVLLPRRNGDPRVIVSRDGSIVIRR